MRRCGIILIGIILIFSLYSLYLFRDAKFVQYIHGRPSEKIEGIFFLKTSQKERIFIFISGIPVDIKTKLQFRISIWPELYMISVSTRYNAISTKIYFKSRHYQLTWFVSICFAIKCVSSKKRETLCLPWY